MMAGVERLNVLMPTPPPVTSGAFSSRRMLLSVVTMTSPPMISTPPNDLASLAWVGREVAGVAPTTQRLPGSRKLSEMSPENEPKAVLKTSRLFTTRGMP